MGAGGAAANGFCRALRMADGYYLIGANCDEYGMALAETDEVHLLPSAGDSAYTDELVALCDRVKPDLVHAQNDDEVARLSFLRESLPVFLPSQRAIRICQNKWLSYCSWRGRVPQPQTQIIFFPDDLRRMFAKHGELWIRAIRGAGGAGSIATDDPDFGVKWIERHDGWGKFTAAEVLTPETATWTALWHDGELVVGQGRRRVNWAYSRNQPSGVSGITGVGETYGDADFNKVAVAAIRAVDKAPHGLYGVDCAKDHLGIWNPTEINVGRFHTTVSEFFARAGLNIPNIYCQMSGEGDFFGGPSLNPLSSGRRWIRLMDKNPVLL